MAIPVNSFETFDSIGNREALMNRIFDISPTDTPVLSSIPRGKASATFEEWQTDALDAAAQNVQIEGDDAAFGVITPTVRLGNYTAITTKNIVITGTQDVVDKAGRGRETAYQVLRKGKEIKNSLELMILDNNARAAGSSGVPRQVAGIPAWLTTNTVFQSGSSGADPTGDGTDARTDDGVPVAFTEVMLQDALQSMWDNGGQPEGAQLVSGSFNRRQLSTFDGDTTKFHRSETGRLVASIRVYESDFGAVRAVPDRFGRARDVFVLDPSFLEFRELRPMNVTDLAKTGDSTKKQLLTEWTLVVRNEAAHAGIYDLTVA